jgi:cytochrome c556
MNLAMMEGRHAAPPGSTPGPGESRPGEIDAAIAENRQEFNQFADLVRSRAIEALHAIDKKDPKALFSVGSKIDSACESCHVTFWYPNSPRPAT